jgi:hypothetical protein
VQLEWQGMGSRNRPMGSTKRALGPSALIHSPLPYDDAFLQVVGQLIKEDIVVRRWDRQRRIFLCGASADRKHSVRERLNDALQRMEYGRIAVYYPEKLFDELLTGVGHHDLLSLENLLAEGVTAIVVILESPGALTELGAFTNHEALRRKLIVIQDSAYARDKSFIQLGPVRMLREQGIGTVIDVDFDKPEACLSTLSRAITEASREGAPFNIANVFHTHEFVLPALYVLDRLPRNGLVHMVKTVAQISNQKAEAIVAASLRMLLSEQAVAATPSGFTLTSKGQERVRPSQVSWAYRNVRNRPTHLLSHRTLDMLRIRVLHKVCGRTQRRLLNE